MLFGNIAILYHKIHTMSSLVFQPIFSGRRFELWTENPGNERVSSHCSCSMDLNGFAGRVKSRNWWFIIAAGPVLSSSSSVTLYNPPSHWLGCVNFSAMQLFATKGSYLHGGGVKETIEDGLKRRHPRCHRGGAGDVATPSIKCRNWQTILSNLLLKCKFDELLLLPIYYNKQKSHYKLQSVQQSNTRCHCLSRITLSCCSLDHNYYYSYPRPRVTIEFGGLLRSFNSEGSFGIAPMWATTSSR